MKIFDAILSGEGVEPPMDTEIDSTNGVFVNQGPQTFKLADDPRSNQTGLIGNRLGQIIRLIKITIDAVELVRHKGQRKILGVFGFVVSECQIVTCLVEQAGDLKAGCAKRRVTRGIGRKIWLEGNVIRIRVRRSIRFPDGVSEIDQMFMSSRRRRGDRPRF